MLGPLPRRRGLPVFTVRFALFAFGDEGTFFFVGFAMGSDSNQATDELHWLAAQNFSEARVSRPGAIGWAAIRLCPRALDTLPRQPDAR